MGNSLEKEEIEVLKNDLFGREIGSEQLEEVFRKECKEGEEMNLKEALNFTRKLIKINQIDDKVSAQPFFSSFFFF